MNLKIPVPCVYGALSRLLILDFLYFLSSVKSDLLDDESKDGESDSGYTGTYAYHAFYLCFDHSVGSVSGLGSGVFVPIGIDSNFLFLRLECLYQYELVPNRFDSFKCFGAQIYFYISKFKLSFIVIVVV